MARKVRKTQDASSDDDTPEVVSHSASRADAKRNQKIIQDFETGEKARKKARNRERDQKLKERARVTRGEKTGEKRKGIRFVDRASDREEEGEGDDRDDVEARMLRAMRDAEDEVDSGEGGEGEGLRGFEREMDSSDDVAMRSDASFAQDEEDEDTRWSGGDSIDPDASTDEEMDEDEAALLQANVAHRPNKKAEYLADELFAAAFASQNSKPLPIKSAEASQQEKVKKRARKSRAHPKDLVIGGRTIRTLPPPSDPRSQATARSVPSARVRRFLDHSLAMKGKQALLKAKKKGWERRPANVGVMKYQGAPHGFVRSMR